MNAVGRLGSYISRGVYTVSGPFHPFGGCVDIIVVEQQDGSFKSSPWYVRFGKFQGVLKTKEKVVKICVNGVEANFSMYLDHKGEAYFLKEVDVVEEAESVLNHLSSGDEEMEGRSRGDRMPLQSESCNFDVGNSIPVGQIDASNGKVTRRSNSRRAQILGLVFGRRSMRENDYGREKENDMPRVDSLERAEFAAKLLEVKWSTNLDTSKPRKDNASLFSDSNVLDGQACRDVEIDGQMSHVCSSEKYAETSTLSEIVPESESEVASNVTRYADESTTMLVTECEENADGVCSEGVGANDLQVPMELEVCTSKQLDEEEVFNRKDVELQLPDHGITPNGRIDTVQSSIYCESSERSIVRNDASSEQTQEALYIASGGCGDLHVHAEMLHTRTELLSEDMVIEQLFEDFQLEVPMVVGPNGYSERTNPFCSCTEPFIAPDSDAQIIHTNPMSGSGEEVEPESLSTISSFTKFQQFKDEENTKAEGIIKLQHSSKSEITEESNILPLISLEEEQLLFGNIDEFKSSEIQRIESKPPVDTDKENFPSSSPKSTEELNDNQSHSSAEKFEEENQSTDSEVEDSTGNMRATSSPIGITRYNDAAVEEVGRLAESLPNMWSPTESFGENDVNLSHSLDSNSKPLNWAMRSKDNLSSIVSDGDKEHQLAAELSVIKDDFVTGELKDIPSNPEVGSCRKSHKLCSMQKFLFAKTCSPTLASQAFDAEKPDLEKFTALGPEVMKDDWLVLRINGCYFPWDAAASYCFRNGFIWKFTNIEPKDMIVIDQVEKTITGDPSKAVIAPSENWGLWPFSFRRSRSRKGMQPVLSDVGNSDADNASEIKFGVAEAKDMLEGKVVKKTVRVLCPTSEQLASLNLREGRNTVTYTFLTPMLGKQQVDARIYLWKWNTQIVISDVDGTITRSDVLGQFMPLVGVDWSHLGVAHLFSAIKENGYQLLFLSARAISQAYLTRQFLFNLKQDGKALPDGPVVISPDGLFPSLYREVIRRAPHEFKISCLEEIRSLFPSDCNPFYAGFGNRDTDEISYLKVGIPKGKIFIINPKGEVAVNRRLDTKSYKSIHALVNGMFPPATSFEQEDFNSWNFWKLPPPVIDV